MGAALRLLQLTDLHLTAHPDLAHKGVYPWQRWQQALAQLRQQPHDLLLLSGDLAQHDAPNAYAALAQSLADWPRPWRVIPGNHDDLVQMQAALPASALCKSEVWGSWQLLYAYSCAHPDGRGGAALGQDELAWLAQQLRHPQAANQLLLIHHPPLPVFSAWQDAIMLADADALLRLTEQAAHLRVLLCGHVHQAHHWRYQHWQAFSTPALAAQFAPYQAQMTLATGQQNLAAWRWLQLFEDASMHTTVQRFSG